MKKIEVIEEILEEHRPYDRRQGVVWNLENLKGYYKDMENAYWYDKVCGWLEGYKETEVIVRRTFTTAGRRGCPRLIEDIECEDRFITDTNDVELIKQVWMRKHGITKELHYDYFVVDSESDILVKVMFEIVGGEG